LTAAVFSRPLNWRAAGSPLRTAPRDETIDLPSRPTETRKAGEENPMAENTMIFDDYHERFYRRHGRRVMRVVLNRLYQSQADPEDVLQSILMSFAGRLRHDHPGSGEAEDLWGPLLAAALRHCDKHNKRWTRGKQAGKIPVPYSVLEGPAGEPEGAFDTADERSDLEEVERGDWLEAFLRRLEQAGLVEEELAVLRLKLAEHTVEEIAKRTGFTVARVRAVLRRIRRVGEQFLEEGSP
jgi:DNA-directed RNA polymerase specialized sigma24 family protein